MSVYLCAKFQVFSITLTRFRLVVIYPLQPQNESLKSPPRLGLNLFDDCATECVGGRVYVYFLGTQ